MGPTTMPHPKKKTVRISFQSPGTKPPVFLAGTFTYPAWQPKEMDHRAKPEVEGKEPSDELEFYGTYDVPEGNHQYKFRLGDGDWWVCDESSETVLDEAGNRNNLLRVASQSLTTQDRAKTSVPEKKHAHARPHISWGATDPNPVWDLIGIDPAEASNDQHLLSPPIHELDCPLREHHDPDHPTYLAKAADAYRCDESSINPTGTRGESKVNGSKSEVDDEAVSQAVKPRPSVIRVSPTNVREHLFIPAPKNTPVFHETLASPPRQQDDERSLSPYGSQGSRTFGSYKANDLDAIQDIRFRNTTLASTPEEEEDLPDTEEMDCLNDESPQRRQLSHADIQSVRRSMTHLAAKSNQRLVNSAESDQTTPYDPDDHSEAPRLPHEALTPMTPQNTFPRSNTMTPKLFPQAHSRIPTISLLNDPILAAFPTGDHGLLSRRAAAANGKEKLGDKLGHEWIGGEDLMSDEEEDEQPLSAMTHSPTFSHEVPLDYQQIRQESLHRRLSSATDGASDPKISTRFLKTSTNGSYTTRQKLSPNPRYGSLHGSFADVKRINSLGEEIEDEDASPLIPGKVSQDSLIEGPRPRKGSGASFKTARSRSSSCCGSTSSSYAPETGTVTFWKRMWQILTGWIARWWAACMRKENNDGMMSDESSRRATKKRM